MGDHEYEPVSLPPPTVRVTGPYDRYEPELGTAPREGSNSSTESRERKERKFLRKPLDDELVGLPIDGEGSEDEVLEVEEKEEDDRAIAAPSPGTTTGSRTDLELNTSQVDSSALEDLPLSREGRRQQRLKQMEERGPGAAARSLQRIRNQAGKLRTKLRNIKRPNINMPERPRFSMPERPKFNLPERPKFNLPERPKFNLPERPKFNLPERPKFNLPQRPKFNLPERPKFNMPERPKFNFPSFSMPRSGFRKPLRENDSQNVHNDTPAPSTPGKRNYFDFRTYPRIFDRKSRQHTRELNIGAPTNVRHITPPAINYDDDDDEEMEEIEDDDEPVRKPQLPPRRKNSENSTSGRWVGKFTELDYVDSENVRPPVRVNGAPRPFYDDEDDEEIRALEKELKLTSGRRSSDEDHSESLSGFRDKDFGYAVSMGPGKLPQLPKQTPTQAMVVDPDDLDPDEIESFPGSEHDVAHSSGSSSDRHRAGVLEEIDSDEFFLREKGLSQEDVDVGRYLSSEIREAFRPVPPETKTIIVENITVNEAELARSYRGTPERANAPNNKTRPPRRTRAARQRSNPTTPTEPVPERYFNTFPPNKPTRNRRRLLRQQEKVKKEHSSTMGRPLPPMVPKRKKTTRSEAVLDTTSQWSEDLNNDWLKNVEENIVPVQMAVQKMESDDHEYIIPEAPAAPKRGRRTSRQTPDEDARSHVSVEQPDPGYATVIKPGVIEIEIVDTVGQPCTPPPRRVKTLPRPPFPSIRRRRNRPLSGSNQHPHFSTVPHRRGPPTRPMRNYATLGPARPPRKSRSGSVDDLQDRSLQSGAVIQKMKERPLPPPPRPPRRERGMDTESNQGEQFDELQAEMMELTQDAPMAASEDIDGNATPVQRVDVEMENAINNAVKVYEDSPLEEEHVIQHVIQLSSEVVHIEKEILPEPKQSEIIKTDEVISDVAQSSSKADETVPETVQVKTSESLISTTSETKQEVPLQESKAEDSVVSCLDKTVVCEPATKIEYMEEVTSVAEVSDTPETKPEKSLQESQSEVGIADNSYVTLEPAPPVAPEVIPVAVDDTPTISTQTQSLEYVPEDRKPENQFVSQSSVILATPDTTSKLQEPPVSVQFTETSSAATEPMREIPTEDTATQAMIQSTEVATQSMQDEVYVPVEEVSVSTQTDPIPEEELLRLEMEAEEKEIASRRKEPTPAPPLPPQPAPLFQQQPVPIHLCPELSPATSALLEALSSGQLRLELLDVAKLNVNEVQAQRLMVSDIEGLQLNLNELQGRAGTLVLNSLDAPMGSLAEAIMAAAQQLIPPAPLPLPAPLPVASTSTGTQVSHPSTPVRETSVPLSSHAVVENIISSYTLSSQSESSPSSSDQEASSETSQQTTETIPISQTSTLSRSRQSSPYPSAPVFTTEQVVALQAAALSNAAAARDSSIPPPLPPRRPSTSMYQQSEPQMRPQYPPQQYQQQEIEPGITELGSRLCRACCTATLSALRRVMTYSERQINSAAEETRERSGLQVALCMVLVLVAGLIIVASLGGSSANPIHHHHWDFYMPQ